MAKKTVTAQEVEQFAQTYIYKKIQRVQKALTKALKEASHETPDVANEMLMNILRDPAISMLEYGGATENLIESLGRYQMGKTGKIWEELFVALHEGDKIDISEQKKKLVRI